MSKKDTDVFYPSLSKIPDLNSTTEFGGADGVADGQLGGQSSATLAKNFHRVVSKEDIQTAEDHLFSVFGDFVSNDDYSNPKSPSYDQYLSTALDFFRKDPRRFRKLLFNPRNPTDEKSAVIVILKRMFIGAHKEESAIIKDPSMFDEGAQLVRLTENFVQFSNERCDLMCKSVYSVAPHLNHNTTHHAIGGSDGSGGAGGGGPMSRPGSAVTTNSGDPDSDADEDAQPGKRRGGGGSNNNNKNGDEAEDTSNNLPNDGPGYTSSFMNDVRNVRAKLSHMTVLLSSLCSHVSRMESQATARLELERKLKYCSSHWTKLSQTEQGLVSEGVLRELECRMEYRLCQNLVSTSKQLLGQDNPAIVEFYTDWRRSWEDHKETLTEHALQLSDGAVRAINEVLSKFGATTSDKSRVRGEPAAKVSNKRSDKQQEIEDQRVASYQQKLRSKLGEDRVLLSSADPRTGKMTPVSVSSSRYGGSGTTYTGLPLVLGDEPSHTSTTQHSTSDAESGMMSMGMSSNHMRSITSVPHHQQQQQQHNSSSATNIGGGGSSGNVGVGGTPGKLSQSQQDSQLVANLRHHVQRPRSQCDVRIKKKRATDAMTKILGEDYNQQMIQHNLDRFYNGQSETSFVKSRPLQGKILDWKNQQQQQHKQELFKNGQHQYHHQRGEQQQLPAMSRKLSGAGGDGPFGNSAAGSVSPFDPSNATQQQQQQSTALRPPLALSPKMLRESGGASSASLGQPKSLTGPGLLNESPLSGFTPGSSNAGSRPVSRQAQSIAVIAANAELRNMANAPPERQSVAGAQVEGYGYVPAPIKVNSSYGQGNMRNAKSPSSGNVNNKSSSKRAPGGSTIVERRPTFGGGLGPSVSRKSTSSPKSPIKNERRGGKVKADSGGKAPADGGGGGSLPDRGKVMSQVTTPPPAPTGVGTETRSSNSNSTPESGAESPSVSASVNLVFSPTSTVEGGEGNRFEDSDNPLSSDVDSSASTPQAMPLQQRLLEAAGSESGVSPADSSPDDSVR